MRRLPSRLALAAAMAGALAASPPATAEEKPAAPAGLARFTSHARFVEAKISPKGSYLAAVTTQGGRRALIFIDLATRQVASTFNPSGSSTVGRFFWASDRRVVIELVDHDGTLAAPVSRGEIYAIDADGGSGRMIFGYRAGGGGTGTNLKVAEAERAWGEVVDTLRKDDRTILISSRDMDEASDRMVRLWRLDVHTGLKRQVAVAPIPEAGFLTDGDGEPRLAVGRDAEARLRWYLRDGEQGWRELQRTAGFSDGAEPVAYVAEDRAVEVVEPHEGGFGLFSVSVDTGERRLLARTEVAPPSVFLRDRETRRLVAIESQPDLPAVEVLDPEHPAARVLEGLLAAYPGQHVRIVSRTDDERRAVAFVYGDRNPGQYLLVDAEKLSAEPLVEVRPGLRAEELGEVQAFHVAASDGLRIHGYLTLPPGAPAGVKPPLVVLPHGGPHGVRDHWGFDWEAQLLASQGFAVLQVNYRGSGGYGDAYEEAGYRRWGDRVVQDVIDATRWAVRKGKVDGGRVCAVGTSFGAYAAMQASILAPDLFRCAAGLSGVYDLTLMSWRGDISWSRRGRGYVRKAVGEDEAALRAASPVHQVARLTAPVLLAHGGRDRRTPLAHAEKLRDALVEAGRPPEWLVEATEGHGFWDEAARERLYARVVAFLKRHTAAAAATSPAPAAAATPATP